MGNDLYVLQWYQEEHTHRLRNKAWRQEDLHFKELEKVWRDVDSKRSRLTQVCTCSEILWFSCVHTCVCSVRFKVRMRLCLGLIWALSL